MVELSRFTHVFDLGENVALYHSLRMKPVYLTKEAYGSLCEWLASAQDATVDDTPESISLEAKELVKYKILVRSADEDARVLQFVRSKIPAPMTCVCYLILLRVSTASLETTTK